nr:hypothetical protein HmN_000173900 [Hymenolepis microstoma]
MSRSNYIMCCDTDNPDTTEYASGPGFASSQRVFILVSASVLVDEIANSSYFQFLSSSSFRDFQYQTHVISNWYCD